MRHEDYCTILSYGGEDASILRSKLHDVNMRLYASSPSYKGIIQNIAGYILWCAQTKREGYKQPHGFSGANAGIPFNIIATRYEVMLNPHILHSSVKRVTSNSNCGSLLLPEPIKIVRYATITYEFWDLHGKRYERTDYAPTVQHEVDHNNGILITDRRIDL